MKRTDLLEALRRVAPALANRKFVPIMSCFCFTAKEVVAYNDTVALGAPLASGLSGGLEGEVLLRWLGESRAPEVEISQDKKRVQLKASRSRLELKAMPPDAFVFEWPKVPEADISLPLADELLEAIKKCCVSMGNDPSQPWQTGITVAFDKRQVRLYSTNNIAAFMTAIDLKVPKALRKLVLLLPPAFCSLLVATAGRDEAKDLLVDNAWVIARFASGLRLFGRVSTEASLEDYSSIFSDKLAGQAEALLVPVPSGLTSTLARNRVVLNGNDKFSQMVISEEKLVVSSKGIGQVTDKVRMPGHHDCKIEMSPEVLSSALEHAKKLCFIEGKCAVLRGKGFTRVVAVVTGKE